MTLKPLYHTPVKDNLKISLGQAIKYDFLLLTVLLQFNVSGCFDMIRVLQ